jgi:hypothetical protein
VTDLAHILATSALGVILALMLWMWLARRLAHAGKSRWRAVPLCLVLLLIPLGYGVFWLVFFSSPAAAVQAHAIRLTLEHFIAPFAPWTGVSWLIVSAAIARTA